MLGHEELEAGTNPPLHGGLGREASCGDLLAVETLRGCHLICLSEGYHGLRGTILLVITFGYGQTCQVWSVIEG